MTVAFFDLGAAYREQKVAIDAAVARVLESGWYIQGPELTAFEENFARFCDAKHAIGVANGLDALVLSLRALGIGPNDEVIVPSNTFIATWLAVSEVGATPIAVEPDPATHNLDPVRLAEALTPQTRAIIAVHLYGQPADLNPISAFAKQHGLALIEDAAQAQGATYYGRKIGAHGDLVCWSFYPAKNLGAMGDGGGVTTDNDELADKVRVLSNYGSRQKYHNEVRGKNSRLDPLHAAILDVKLQALEEWNDRRRVIADRFHQAFADTRLTLAAVPDWAGPVWHQYVVRSDRREADIAALAQLGIPTQIHYPLAPSQQPAYSDLALRHPVPIAEELASQVFSLPIGPHQPEEATEQIVQAVLKICG